MKACQDRLGAADAHSADVAKLSGKRENRERESENDGGSEMANS